MQEVSKAYYGALQANHSNEVKHYGVLGMKWGVRKNPSKAFGKASTKARKLGKKSDKKLTKGTKLEYKSAKFKMKANRTRVKASTDPSLQGKAEELTKKSNATYSKAKKLQYKSVKLQNKRTKWIKHMENAFKDTSINQIEEQDLQKGREFIYMLRRD